MAYWERVLNGQVVELLFPEEVHGAGLRLFDSVGQAFLPAFPPKDADRNVCATFLTTLSARPSTSSPPSKPSASSKARHERPRKIFSPRSPAGAVQATISETETVRPEGDRGVSRVAGLACPDFPSTFPRRSLSA